MSPLRPSELEAIFGPDFVAPDWDGSGPWPHPAALPEDELLRQCRFGQGRSGGPGGQHRNKVETKVVATHTPTGIAAQAGERREMTENRRVAIFRLRLALAARHRVPTPAGQLGSELWRSRLETKRTKDGKKRTRIAVNPAHRDFPAMLAEAMDVLAASGWQPRTAALRLGVTATQLLKLVKDHPEALAVVNAEREKLGRGRLK